MWFGRLCRCLRMEYPGSRSTRLMTLLHVCIAGLEWVLDLLTHCSHVQFFLMSSKNLENRNLCKGMDLAGSKVLQYNFLRTTRASFATHGVQSGPRRMMHRTTLAGMRDLPSTPTGPSQCPRAICGGRPSDPSPTCRSNPTVCRSLGERLPSHECARGCGGVGYWRGPPFIPVQGMIGGLSAGRHVAGMFLLCKEGLLWASLLASVEQDNGP